MRTLAALLLLPFLLLAGHAGAAGPAPATASPRGPGGPGETDRRTTISIAYVSDVHAQIEPHAELFWDERGERRVRDAGGLARIATVLRRLREERPDRVLFVDGGDTIQGSGPAAWTEGTVVIEPTNALGYDLGVPGNWSVAYGKDALLERAAELDHPLVAANMLHADSEEPVFERYVIHELGGVRVGVIGFTDPDIPRRQPPHLSGGLAFVGPEVLQPLVDELRTERDVDVVILATHIGLPKAIGLAERLDGLDVVLSADTHERTYEPIVRGDTWIVEPGAFASFVGVLDITVERGEVVDRDWRLVELLPDRFPEDPAVRGVVDAALAPHRERMDRVIGHTDTWLARYRVLNTSLDTLIADAIRAETGADVAVSNGFRFAPPTEPGPITVGDLWTWLPLRLELKTGLTTGAELWDYWERELEHVFSPDPERLFGGWLTRVSGMRLTCDTTAPSGRRLRELTLAGEPLEAEAVYRVAAGHRAGAPADRVHRIAGCTDTRRLGITTHDAVERFLAEHSPIRIVDDRRVRCVVVDGVMRSQTLGPLHRETEGEPDGPPPGLPTGDATREP